MLAGTLRNELFLQECCLGSLTLLLFLEQAMTGNVISPLALESPNLQLPVPLLLWAGAIHNCGRPVCVRVRVRVCAGLSARATETNNCAI